MSLHVSRVTLHVSGLPDISPVWTGKWQICCSGAICSAISHFGCSDILKGWCWIWRPWWNWYRGVFGKLSEEGSLFLLIIHEPVPLAVNWPWPPKIYCSLSISVDKSANFLRRININGNCNAGDGVGESEDSNAKIDLWKYFLNFLNTMLASSDKGEMLAESILWTTSTNNAAFSRPNDLLWEEDLITMWTTECVIQSLADLKPLLRRKL